MTITKKYKHGTIVPLVGGQSIAGREVLGSDPDFLLTYTPFAENEKNIRAYLPNVPYEVLDAGGNMEAGKDSDVISALCPCAGLSALGTGTAEARDAANSWMYRSAEHVLGALKPKVFFGENAPALYSEGSEKAKFVRDKLEAIAEKHGYTTSYYFTSTHLHGVPQRRHRTFYFFWRENGRVPILPFFKKEAPTWGDYMSQIPAGATQHEDDKPRAIKALTATRFAQYAKHLHGDAWPNVIRDHMRKADKNMMTVQDFILNDKSDLEKPQAMRAWFASNGDTRSVEYVDRIIAKLATGKGVWDDSPAIFLPEGNFNALIGRTTDSAHPYEHRSLTIRECMHMMALPHDFQLVTKVINNICQNVPVCTSSDMYRGIVEYLEGRTTMVDSKVGFQNNFKEVFEFNRSTVESKLMVF
jgi:site-specific DNA-cytosine methylase